MEIVNVLTTRVFSHMVLYRARADIAGAAHPAQPDPLFALAGPDHTNHPRLVLPHKSHTRAALLQRAVGLIVGCRQVHLGSADDRRREGQRSRGGRVRLCDDGTYLPYQRHGTTA
jgi:hypothetical protein